MEKKYMEVLLAQIREKRAKECIRQEIEGHIHDQKECYIADGLSSDEAEQKAVTDMGDPVETGIALNRIHQPRPAWGMLAVIAVLCAAGILLQYAVYQTNPSADMNTYFLKNQCLHSILGFFVLCIVYLVDYTRIAAYSRHMCTGILLLFFMLAMDSQTAFDLPLPVSYLQHTSTVIFLGNWWISIHFFFYLYLPLYGAVLYERSRRKKWRLIWYTLLPIYFAFRLAHLSVMINVTVIMLLLLGTAAAKGWLTAYTGKKISLKKRCLIFTAVSAVLALCALFFANLNSYQHFRIQAWFRPELSSAGYVDHLVRDIIRTSQLTGKNTGQSMTGFPLEFETDYLLTYLIGTFGILAGVVLILFLTLLGARLLHISLRQKNQPGMIMGLGCSLVFLIQAAEYILVNLSLLPVSGLYFPLISYGGSGMLQTCILLGILLSIYRYENIVSHTGLYYRAD